MREVEERSEVDMQGGHLGWGEKKRKYRLSLIIFEQKLIPFFQNQGIPTGWRRQLFVITLTEVRNSIMNASLNMFRRTFDQCLYSVHHLTQAIQTLRCF